MDVKKCTVCKIKTTKDIYKKDRNISKNFYNMNRKKYNNKSITKNDKNKKERKIADSVKNKKTKRKEKKSVDSENNNRTLFAGGSNSGKSYLMNHILLQKEDPFFIITNQKTNILLSKLKH